MTAQRAITFVEIDIPYCTLSYGVAPCTAVLGVDSETKCFNTYSTCAKREDFDEGTVTLRFAKAAAYLDESGIDAIPSIIDARYEPAELSLGEPSLGVRAKLSVTLSDHPYGDTGAGFDKYRTERTYDPAKVGTFWGKFRARHPVLKGRPIRLIRGFVGQTIEEMETRHLFVDSTDTDEDGRFTITGKDVIKLADGDRALAPTPSKGYLVADITAGATSATLAPSGIGNAEYPSSGHLAIGGSEIVAFTRSGDTLTLTRGQFGTEAQSHSAQDRAQVCLYYQGVDPANIIEDLFTTYANIPDAQIPLADWKDETAAYLRRVYTAMIAEPTPVRDLVSELVEQAALVLIPDDITQTIRLQVLRTINTDAAIWSEENIGKGTLRIKDQPAKRITNCITYYGLINPLENVDDPKNYRSIEAYDATDFDVENQPTIKRIFSRWIPAFGRTVAERLNLIQIGRYQSAPRAFSFDVFRDRDPQLGTGYLMSSWPMQLASGERDQVPMQITRMRPGDAWLSLEGEEVRFLDLDEQDLTNRVIIIDGSANNINLRSIHDSLFPPLTEGDEITFIVNSGVVVGSTSTGSPAMHVGTWPAGFVPLVQSFYRAPRFGVAVVVVVAVVRASANPAAAAAAAVPALWLDRAALGAPALSTTVRLESPARQPLAAQVVAADMRRVMVAQDAAGNAVAGCEIEVRNEDTGLLAVLYSDRDGLNQISNRFTAPDATFSFHTTGGAYRVVATKGAFSAEWRFVAIGTMQEQDVEGIVFALQAGIVPALTRAELELYIPPVPEEGEALPRAGVVYADPVVSNNGYWVYSFDDEEWQWARPLSDTLARLTIVGGDENAIVATASPGVDPASVIGFFIDPPTPNTGPVTVSINGDDPVSAYDYTGAEFPEGAFSNRLFLTREVDGSLRSVMPADIIAQADQKRLYAEEWAQSANPISVAAGGDGVADRSSKYWAGESESFAAAAAASGANEFAATRASLKALDTSSFTHAYLTEVGREGQFRWNAADLSAKLLGPAVASSAVDSATDTITSTAHGLYTGHAVIITAAVNGLSANTLYYAIRVDANIFKLATSFANAFAATAVDLTGTDPVEVKRHRDPMQGIYVTKDADITGASGAWVRMDGGWAVGPASVRLFGAKGDKTDDSEAIYGAYAFTTLLKFPAVQSGDFYLMDSADFLLAAVDYERQDVLLVGDTKGTNGEWTSSIKFGSSVGLRVDGATGNYVLNKLVTQDLFMGPKDSVSRTTPIFDFTGLLYWERYNCHFQGDTLKEQPVLRGRWSLGLTSRNCNIWSGLISEDFGTASDPFNAISCVGDNHNGSRYVGQYAATAFSKLDGLIQSCGDGFDVSWTKAESSSSIVIKGNYFENNKFHDGTGFTGRDIRLGDGGYARAIDISNNYHAQLAADNPFTTGSVGMSDIPPVLIKKVIGGGIRDNFWTNGGLSEYVELGHFNSAGVRFPRNIEIINNLDLFTNGGWSNHAADPGGKTMYGVTEAVFHEWLRKKGHPIRPVRSITKDEALEIYFEGYWKPSGGPTLAEGVDLATYDSSVNSGVSRGRKWLLASIGGPDHETVKKICAKRLSFVQGLGTWKVFGKGWGNRIADIQAKGVAWALSAQNDNVVVREQLRDEAAESDKKAKQNQTGAGASGAGGAGTVGADRAVDIPQWFAVGLTIGFIALAAFLIWKGVQKRREAKAYEREAAALDV
eukprot:jgi/Tetstr1/450637/TSEL_037673.t1